MTVLIASSLESPRLISALTVCVSWVVMVVVVGSGLAVSPADD